MKVLHIDVLVRSRFALTPQKQTFFGSHLLDGNVLNSETQNDGPDHTQSHFHVAIDNFLCTNGHQLDSLGGNEIQGLVDVGNLVKSHLATVRLLQGLAGNDLEQEHEFEAIAEVLFDILDLRACFSQVGIHPSREGLKSSCKTS